MANRAFFSVFNIFKPRIVHRRNKIKMYKAIIRTVVCYGSESRALIEITVALLDCFDRKMSRMICFVCGWKMKNTEKRGVGPSLRRPPSFMSHEVDVTQVDGTCAANATVKSVSSVPGGRKPLGRPRMRWEDNVNSDVIEMLALRG